MVTYDEIVLIKISSPQYFLIMMTGDVDCTVVCRMEAEYVMVVWEGPFIFILLFYFIVSLYYMKYKYHR